TVLLAAAWMCAAFLATPSAAAPSRPAAGAPRGRTTRDLADPLLLRGLEWRSIGPYRGGRVTAVTGVVGQPNVYYLGGPGARIWCTSPRSATRSDRIASGACSVPRTAAPAGRTCCS